MISEEFPQSEYTTINIPYTLSQIVINTHDRQQHIIGELDDYFYRTSVTDITISNNFFGFNIEDANEFYLNHQVIIESGDGQAIHNGITGIGLVNLVLDKSNDQFILKFIDDKGNVVDMPECTFSLKDKKTGQIVASNITVKGGQAIFSLPDAINPEDILILNSLSGIANKPKPNLTLNKTGNTYLDTVVTASLKNSSQALGDEKIMVIFNKYDSRTKKSSNGSYIVETISDGTQICDGKTKYRDGVYWSMIIDDPEYDTVTITVLYSSKEFGLAKQTVICRLSCNDAYLTLKPSARQYNPNHKKYDMIRVDGITLTYDTYGKYHAPELEYLLYKNNKLIYKTYVWHMDDGHYYIQNIDMPTLNAGTYKVVIRDYGNSVYTFSPKTTTLEITKIKASVKAPKITAKLKKSKYFKVTVKSNNKPLKSFKIKVKVYTGKKAKVYTLKTNKNGVASLNTKKLKKGSHKVVISSGNVNYQVSAKSKITIKR